MIKSKVEKSLFREYFILTPWETEVDDPCINKYCSDFVPRIDTYTETRKENNLPKINPKKRAISHCNTHTKAQSMTNSEKYNQNKGYYRSQVQNYLQTFHTLSQHKIERPQKKKPESRGPLQEINVKNFIIEGGQTASNQKQKFTKKRQSSYIMKQKFAQFRRSMKTIDQNKENSNVRVIRYQC